MHNVTRKTSHLKMFEKWIILKRNQTPNKLLKKKLITGVKSRTIKLKFNLKLWNKFHLSCELHQSMGKKNLKKNLSTTFLIDITLNAIFLRISKSWPFTNSFTSNIPFVQKPVNELHSKSVDWFLYERNVSRESVRTKIQQLNTSS